MNSILISAIAVVGSWGWVYESPVTVYPQFEYARTVQVVPQQFYQAPVTIYPQYEYTRTIHAAPQQYYQAPVFYGQASGTCINGSCSSSPRRVVIPRRVIRYR